MKYIYFSIKDVDSDWLVRASDVNSKAEERQSEEQHEFISSKSAVWRDMKPKLEKLSDGKCWYSEARERVSYLHVDHYRPKKLYPWLAFDWKNFRLCGSKPNCKKTDEFPLEDEYFRASSKSSDLNTERPLLLDPIKWGDPDLLTFKADGEPTCACPTNETAARRVRETVSTLELDSAILCEERRAKWRECERKLKKLRSLVEEARQRENSDAAAFSIELCEDITKLFDERAEFTSTAKACMTELEATELVALARAVVQRTVQQGCSTLGALS